MSSNAPDSVSFPILPETSIAVVEKSQFKQAIFDRLCSGWSPARVSSWLRDTYQEEVTPAAINQFFDEIPTIYILPPTLIKSRLAMLDVQTDSITDLGRTLRMQEERVAAHHLVSELSTDSEGKQAFGTQYRKDLKLYFNMLIEYTKLMQSLGVFATEPQKFEVGVDDEVPTLGDLIKKKQEAPVE